MISTFLSHELKAFWRSKNTGKSIVIRVVMGIFIFYPLLNSSLVLGFFLDKILDKTFPVGRPQKLRFAASSSSIIYPTF